jgi:hypothetical protein
MSKVILKYNDTFHLKGPRNTTGTLRLARLRIDNLTRDISYAMLECR